MNNELREDYTEILLDKFEQGLYALEKMKITSPKYKDLVVNMNNTNNIIQQFDIEIDNVNKTNKDKDKDNADADTATIVEK